MITVQLLEQFLKDSKLKEKDYKGMLEKLKTLDDYLKELDLQLSSCRSPQEIIDTASLYTGCPFFYFDESYSIIAITKDLEFEHDEEWEHMLKKGYLSPLTARLMKEGGDLGVLAAASSPVLYYNPDLFPFHSVVSNVRLNGRFMARLNMLGVERDPDQSDIEVNRIVVDHLTRLLSESEKSKGSKALKNMLKDILKGARYSESYIENHLIETKIPPESIFSLYAIDTDSSGDPQILLYYESGLERVMIGEKVIIFTYGDNVIMLAFSTSEDGFGSVEFKLEAFLNAQNLSCGAANHFKSISMLSGIYSQALAALKERGAKKLSRYGDVMLENLLSYVPEDEIQFVIVDDIYKVLEAEESCSFPLMETLKTYLEQGASLQGAADALFIHKNTMLYRLNKLREIISSDLDSPEDLLKLTLSIKLWESDAV